VFSLLAALGISATLGLIVVVPFGYREMKRMSIDPV
jgi:hypothetical protein